VNRAQKIIKKVNEIDTGYGYHVSYSGNADAIKSKGLTPRSASWFGSYTDRVYFAFSPNESWYYVSQNVAQKKDKPEVLLLRVSKDKLKDADNLDAKEFWVKRNVPPEDIEFYDGSSWLPITKVKSNVRYEFSKFLLKLDKKVYLNYYK